MYQRLLAAIAAVRGLYALRRFRVYRSGLHRAAQKVEEAAVRVERAAAEVERLTGEGPEQ